MKKTSLFHLFLSAAALAALLAPITARAAAGDLYVTDLLAGTIVKFTPTGAKSTFASGLNGPNGLAFDKNGSLFEADTGSGTIFKFTTAGAKSTFASGLSHPLALAFDGGGNLFVTDICDLATGCGTIFKFTPAGTKSTFASGQNFVGLAFDILSNLFAGEKQGGIVKFTPAGSKSTFASAVGEPAGLAFDSSGNFLAADNSSGTIFKFTPAGATSTFASGLDGPTGLAFDKDGNLFVPDANNGTIFKFTPAGTKSTFASGLGASTFLAIQPVTEKLRNISARGFVQTGNNILIGGFILGGNALANNAVVLRAIGPSLSQAGIANPLQNPTLELHNSSGAIIASNNNWQDTQGPQIIATGIAPTDPRESAIFATLSAGAYTAVVRGANNSTGVALVEIYSVSK